MKKILLLILLPLLIGQTPLWASSSMVKGGEIVISQGETVEDIVAYGSKIVIRGNVFGTVYAVASEVTIDSGSDVKGDITLIKGFLTIQGNPGIKGKITVYETMIKSDLPYMVKGDALVFKDLGFNVQSIQSPVSPAVIQHMEKYLVMQRPIPTQAGLLFPDFISKGPAVADIRSFKVSNLVEFSMQKEIVESSISMTGSFEGKTVDLTAIRFMAHSDAEFFWSKVRTIPEARINHSLHISLADGAHWYFRHKESSIVMWYRDNWFFCVDIGGGSSASERDQLRDRIVEFYSAKYPRSEK